MMKPGCFMAFVDLRDAYYTVPVHPEHRKYLKFLFNGTLYQYTCLPNGLSSAPRIFTKLLKQFLPHCMNKATLIQVTLMIHIYRVILPLSALLM